MRAARARNGIRTRSGRMRLGKNYLTGIQYAPQGAPSFYTYGNNLAHTNNFNSRLQLSSCWDAVGNSSNNFLLSVYPYWGGTNNNGNLQSATFQAGGPGPLSALATFNVSYSYDAAGNQLVANGDTLSYDAENRMISAAEPPALGGATETYVYDGSGQRVQKTGPGGTTTYVYDAFGNLAAEYGAVAKPSCTTCYLSFDHLGSVRIGAAGLLAVWGRDPGWVCGALRESAVWGERRCGAEVHRPSQRQRNGSGLFYCAVLWIGIGTVYVTRSRERGSGSDGSAVVERVCICEEQSAGAGGSDGVVPHRSG